MVEIPGQKRISTITTAEDVIDQISKLAQAKKKKEQNLPCKTDVEKSLISMGEEILSIKNENKKNNLFIPLYRKLIKELNQLR